MRVHYHPGSRLIDAAEGSELGRFHRGVAAISHSLSTDSLGSDSGGEARGRRLGKGRARPGGSGGARPGQLGWAGLGSVSQAAGPLSGPIPPLRSLRSQIRAVPEAKD